MLFATWEHGIFRHSCNRNIHLFRPLELKEQLLFLQYVFNKFRNFILNFIFIFKSDNLIFNLLIVLVKLKCLNPAI